MKRKSPFTILYVHSSSDSYGSDRALLSLVTNLDQTRFKPLVLVPEQGTFTADLDAHHIPYIVYPISILRRANLTPRGLAEFVWRFPASVVKIMRIARTHQASVIHTNTSVILPGAIAARLLGIPHIWHAREFINISNSPAKRLYTWFMQAMSKQVITVSNSVAAQFASQKKTLTIYDGINVAHFSQFTQPQRAISDNAIVIGNIGRINALKGQDDLIRAFAQVHAAHPNTRLVIMGDVYKNQHKFRDKLTTLIAELGLNAHVTLTGFHQDIRPELARFDIFAMPSICEGLGIASLEAMAMSKPVVVSRIGGLQEIITDKINGLLAEPQNPDDLAHQLLILVENRALRERLSAAAFATVSEKFSQQRTVTAIEQLYNHYAK